MLLETLVTIAILIMLFCAWLFGAGWLDEVKKNADLKEENNALRVELGELRALFKLQNESLKYNSNN